MVKTNGSKLERNDLVNRVLESLGDKFPKYYVWGTFSELDDGRSPESIISREVVIYNALEDPETKKLVLKELEKDLTKVIDPEILVEVKTLKDEEGIHILYRLVEGDSNLSLRATELLAHERTPIGKYCEALAFAKAIEKGGDKAKKYAMQAFEIICDESNGLNKVQRSRIAGIINRYNDPEISTIVDDFIRKQRVLSRPTGYTP